MTRTDRLSRILELLTEHGSVAVDDLVEDLGISHATARRDLDVLAEQQLITRTHGGARSRSESFDLPLRYKYGQHSDQKRRIAHTASALVEPGAIIGMTGGTTLTSLAETLGARPEFTAPGAEPTLTVVTNAINIASLLVLRPQINVVVPGGVVHSRSFELTGPFAEHTISAVSLDIAFLGVNGIDAERGPSVHDDQEARVNALMGERARRKYLVADSSKIGKRAFVSIGAIETFEALITDDGITDEHRAALEAAGLAVIVADEATSPVRRD